MTLTEALRALHQQRRIRSPWLPGMVAVSAEGTPCRVAVLHGSGGGAVIPGWSTGTLPVGVAFLTGATPDLTDPATVGCLLALLREASGEVVCVQHRRVPSSVDPWVVTGPTSTPQPPWQGVAGPTEGEAIAAALIALAGAP